MTAENFEHVLIALRARTPFEPFVVELNDGSRCEVDSPWALLVRDGVAAFLAPGGIPMWFDHDSVNKIIGEIADAAPELERQLMTDPLSTPPPISIADFQRLIRDMYFEKDLARGIDGTFMWLMEEVGELASALRNGSHEERLGEFADVIAWLATIANVAGVDLTEAIALKYGSGCPGCGKLVCTCDDAEKP